MTKNADLKLELKRYNAKKYEIAKALGLSPTQFSNMIDLAEIVEYEKDRIVTVAIHLDEQKKMM